MNGVGMRMSQIAALICVTLTVGNLSTAAAQDVELEFHFLKAGQSRKAVIAMLGKPSAETESKTLFIKYHRLTWFDPEGRKYSAAFISDRLFRWKTCSGEIGDC